jgi:hypothetical protein
MGGVATCAWHHYDMGRERAMTAVTEAFADLQAQPERHLRLRAALYEAKLAGVRQRDLVAQTGYSREHIRRLIEDERISRGEIEPTARYVRERDRRAERARRDA